MAKVIERRSSRYILLALVLVHLALISRQVDARGGTSFLGRALYAATLPIERAVSGTVRGVSSLWYGYVDLRHARRENADLRRQVDTTRAISRPRARMPMRRGGCGTWWGCKRFSDPDRRGPRDRPRRPAWFQVVMIDKGRADGISLNAAVIGSSGVVGRVIELSDRAAKVQVLLDPNDQRRCRERTKPRHRRGRGQMGTSPGSALDERSDLDRALDVASRGDLLMKYVSAVSDIAVGDSVVTSGFDQVYPRGLLVGRVSYVGPSTGLFKEVRVTPSTRFDSLEEVMVLQPPAALPTNFESVRSR